MTPLVFGVATSALQVEGAIDRHGRGRSIWEDFQEVPGAIADGSRLDHGVHHVDLVERDVGLLQALEVDAYRFSVSWPRVLPEGTGRVSNAGLGFYDRLVDRLLEAGIAPVVTLYHWDLPSALQARGGWGSRATALAFADYAATVAARLDDRVSHWVTVNEPRVAALLGHAAGVHAPGTSDLATALRAAHHLLVGHGLATQAIRAESSNARVGIALDLTPQRPADPDDEAHVAAARLSDGQHNRFFLDPVTGHGYPQDVVAAYGPAMPAVDDEDLELVATTTEFLGINHYRSEVVAPTARPVGGPDWAFALPVDNPPPTTAMGWNIDPPSLREVVEWAVERSVADVVITESGMATQESLDAEELVDDQARIAWLAAHLDVVHEARTDGLPISGYFVWSLLDNFEWAEGYRPRFGLVAASPTSDLRLPKASARWYRDHVRAHR